MHRFLPDQEKLALSGAYRDMRVTLGGLPHLVVVEQQCLERVRNTAAFVSDYLLKCTLYKSERIAGPRVQTNNIDMDVHVRSISGQTAEQCRIGMLTPSFTTKKNPPPRSYATTVSLHPMSGTPP
jgi:hypothetical protein